MAITATIDLWLATAHKDGIKNRNLRTMKETYRVVRLAKSKSELREGETRKGLCSSEKI